MTFSMTKFACRGICRVGETGEARLTGGSLVFQLDRTITHPLQSSVLFVLSDPRFLEQSISPGEYSKMAKRTASQRKKQEEEAGAAEESEDAVMNSSSSSAPVSSFAKQPKGDPAQAVRDKKAIETLVKNFGVKANEIVHVSRDPHSS